MFWNNRTTISRAKSGPASRRGHKTSTVGEKVKFLDPQECRRCGAQKGTGDGCWSCDERVRQNTAPINQADPATVAAWHPDPVGRYEKRYWEGSEWSGHVSTAGVTAWDPLGPSSASHAPVKRFDVVHLENRVNLLERRVNWIAFILTMNWVASVVLWVQTH